MSRAQIIVGFAVSITGSLVMILMVLRDTRFFGKKGKNNEQIKDRL